ncbi:MAG: hypothetical protein ABIG89_00035 [Candidatus Woesearchaeota archaeon]
MYIVALVAIIAVVSVVVMLFGGNKSVTTCADVVSEEGDIGRQAYRGKINYKINENVAWHLVNAIQTCKTFDNILEISTYFGSPLSYCQSKCYQLVTSAMLLSSERYYDDALCDSLSYDSLSYTPIHVENDLSSLGLVGFGSNAKWDTKNYKSNQGGTSRA